MLKSKDMTKGTIIEITNAPVSNMAGSTFGGAFGGPVLGAPIGHEMLKLSPNLVSSNSMLSATQVQMLTGEQYELTAPVGKYGSSQGIAALIARLKQVGGTKEGEIFWVFLADHIKVISTPVPAPETNSHSQSDFALNNGEEFVLVLKSNPKLVFRNYDSSQSHQIGNPISSDPKDVLKGDLIFNSKSGVRKKFKNKAVLLGFLNNISGFLSSNKWHNYFQKNPALASEQKFHLHGLNNLPEWVGDLGIHNLSDLAELELRKYDTKTRSITSVAIDFNCEAYVRRFAQTMELTRIFGEGVSKVINSLITENTLSDYPFLLSAKFDLKKFPPNQIEYGLPIPKEKDIYFDLALKALKLKKKEVPHYNDYGFLTVAFKTQKELDDFKRVYKNTDKVQKDYLTQDVLTHPEILTQDLLGKNLPYTLTSSTPKVSL